MFGNLNFTPQFAVKHDDSTQYGQSTQMHTIFCTNVNDTLLSQDLLDHGHDVNLDGKALLRSIIGSTPQLSPTHREASVSSEVEPDQDRAPVTLGGIQRPAASVERSTESELLFAWNRSTHSGPADAAVAPPLLPSTDACTQIIAPPTHEQCDAPSDAADELPPDHQTLAEETTHPTPTSTPTPTPTPAPAPTAVHVEVSLEASNIDELRAPEEGTEVLEPAAAAHDARGMHCSDTPAAPAHQNEEHASSDIPPATDAAPAVASTEDREPLPGATEGATETSPSSEHDALPDGSKAQETAAAVSVVNNHNAAPEAERQAQQAMQGGAVSGEGDAADERDKPQAGGEENEDLCDDAAGRMLSQTSSSSSEHPLKMGMRVTVKVWSKREKGVIVGVVKEQSSSGSLFKYQVLFKGNKSKKAYTQAVIETEVMDARDPTQEEIRQDEQDRQAEAERRQRADEEQRSREVERELLTSENTLLLEDGDVSGSKQSGRKRAAGHRASTGNKKQRTASTNAKNNARGSVDGLSSCGPSSSKDDHTTSSDDAEMDTKGRGMLTACPEGLDKDDFFLVNELISVRWGSHWSDAVIVDNRQAMEGLYMAQWVGGGAIFSTNIHLGKARRVGMMLDEWQAKRKQEEEAKAAKKNKKKKDPVIVGHVVADDATEEERQASYEFDSENHRERQREENKPDVPDFLNSPDTPRQEPADVKDETEGRRTATKEEKLLEVKLERAEDCADANSTTTSSHDSSSTAGHATRTTSKPKVKPPQKKPVPAPHAHTRGTDKNAAVGNTRPVVKSTPQREIEQGASGRVFRKTFDDVDIPDGNNDLDAAGKFKAGAFVDVSVNRSYAVRYKVVEYESSNHLCVIEDADGHRLKIAHIELRAPSSVVSIRRPLGAAKPLPKVKKTSNKPPASAQLEDCSASPPETPNKRPQPASAAEAPEITTPKADDHVNSPPRTDEQASSTPQGQVSKHTGVGRSPPPTSPTDEKHRVGASAGHKRSLGSGAKASEPPKKQKTAAEGSESSGNDHALLSRYVSHITPLSQTQASAAGSRYQRQLELANRSFFIDDENKTIGSVLSFDPKTHLVAMAPFSVLANGICIEKKPLTYIVDTHLQEKKEVLLRSADVLDSTYLVDEPLSRALNVDANRAQRFYKIAPEPGSKATVKIAEVLADFKATDSTVRVRYYTQARGDNTDVFITDEQEVAGCYDMGHVSMRLNELKRRVLKPSGKEESVSVCRILPDRVDVVPKQIVDQGKLYVHDSTAVAAGAKTLELVPAKLRDVTMMGREYRTRDGRSLYKAFALGATVFYVGGGVLYERPDQLAVGEIKSIYVNDIQQCIVDLVIFERVPGMPEHILVETGQTRKIHARKIHSEANIVSLGSGIRPPPYKDLAVIKTYYCIPSQEAAAK